MVADMQASGGLMLQCLMPSRSTFWDGLSSDEAEFMQKIMRECGDEPWAHSIILSIEENGGLAPANKSRLFELRFGYALHQAGITPNYEIPGEGASTIDFGFSNANETWAVELMRLEESRALRAATSDWTDGSGTQWSQRILSSDSEDQTQTESGETLKAIERVCQKFEKDGRPYKFPVPNNSRNVLLVDFRNFLNGGDKYDRFHVGIGGESIRNEVFRRYWNGQLISGVFSEITNLRGAAEARARLHFLGFVNEQRYESGNFSASIEFIANPGLFPNVEAVEQAIQSWPLQPAVVLNGRH
jgi:hypothetical protein